MYRKTSLVCWSFRTSRWCKNNMLTCRYFTAHNHFACTLMKPPADIFHPTWQGSLGMADIYTSEMVCGSLMLPIVIIATLLTCDTTDDVAEGKHHRSYKLDDNLQATAGLIRGRCVSRARGEEREWFQHERGEGIVIHHHTHASSEIQTIALPCLCLLFAYLLMMQQGLMTRCICAVFMCVRGVSRKQEWVIMGERVFFLFFFWGGAAPSGESVPLAITCTSD